MSEPIWDEAAERAVLGCALLSPSAFQDALSARVTAADFWEPKHGLVWQAMVSLWDAGKPTDRVSVLDELSRRGELIRAGGGPFLYGLTSFDELPTTANVGYHIEIVVRKAKWRRVVQAATAVQQMGEASVESGDPDDALDMLNREVERAGDVHAVQSVLPVADALGPWMDSLDKPLTGLVPTPWPEVDDLLLGGLRPGELAILAARSKMGKSLIGLNIARSAAKAGIPSDYLSGEMNRDELLARLVADVGTVRWSHLTEHRLDADDWTRVRKATDRIAEWPLRIDDQLSGLSTADIRSRCLRQMRFGLGFVVIDQLNFVKPADRRATKNEQLDQSALALKNLAKELNVPILLLHQLNRGPTDRADKRPSADSDMRGSDAISHHADKVLLLWRQEDKHPGEMTFIVDMNRNGPTGDVVLNFEGRYARAVSASPYRQ